MNAVLNKSLSFNLPPINTNIFKSLFPGQVNYMMSMRTESILFTLSAHPFPNSECSSWMTTRWAIQWFIDHWIIHSNRNVPLSMRSIWKSTKLHTRPYSVAFEADRTICGHRTAGMGLGDFYKTYISSVLWTCHEMSHVVSIVVLWRFLSFQADKLYKFCDVITLLLRRIEGSNFWKMFSQYVSANMWKQNWKTFPSLEDNFWGTSTKEERRLNTAMTSELFF